MAAQAKEKLLVILGATATGKSHCAIEVARRFSGRAQGCEIISGDSMLVYRGMDIGTAKPGADELALVPHHLVDILEPGASYSVADFQEQARALITEINARHKLPILVGGTGLYIKAVVEGYAFNAVGGDGALRAELCRFAEEHGADALHARLQEADGASAARIHPHNVRRVVRALEAALRGGAVRQDAARECPYDVLAIGLAMERGALYARIEKRVDAMLAAGLEQEVRALLARGASPQCQSMQGIGYRQMLSYLDGTLAYEEAVAKIKQATRNFAKRQLTWFRKMPYIEWLELAAEPDYEKAVARICEMLVQKGF